MRVYLSEDSSKKLQKAAERRDITPEDLLAQMLRDQHNTDRQDDLAESMSTKKPA